MSRTFSCLSAEQETARRQPRDCPTHVCCSRWVSRRLGPRQLGYRQTWCFDKHVSVKREQRLCEARRVARRVPVVELLAQQIRPFRCGIDGCALHGRDRRDPRRRCCDGVGDDGAVVHSDVLGNCMRCCRWARWLTSEIERIWAGSLCSDCVRQNPWPRLPCAVSCPPYQSVGSNRHTDVSL